MNVESNYPEISDIIYCIEIYLISLFTIYTAIKITNSKINKKSIVIATLVNVIAPIIYWYINHMSNHINSVITLIILLGIIFTVLKKSNLSYSIIVTAISLSINYIIFSLSVLLSYFPYAITKIQNDWINFIFIIIIYIVLWQLLTKIKKFNKGFSFLKEKVKNEYFGITILNMSVIILFTVIILITSTNIPAKKLGIGLAIIGFIELITIKESIQVYYKQKLLIQDLEETKKELAEKNKEVEKLEQENLNFSKTSHSIAHKQKALEYKLNELMLKSEVAEELDIKDRINTISKEISENETIVELTKTEIPEIDDMLKYMQSECIKNKIDYQVKVSGNIFSMINNHISKEELEILLADHIKDAIIAINYSENTNKSILVRLGIIDGIYSLYIYDSGIEFEIDTLQNLGKKPITTHKDDGGTGMGFMNTFDTLRKNKASLIIKELGKPSKDDFTKVIMIKFDKKNEFKIDSYRQQEINI